MLKDQNSDYYGIIGQPIGHSLSPYIHQHFAKLTDQNIFYHAIESSNCNFNQDLREFLYYGKGLNVTAPFKQLAFEIKAEVSEAARIAQAVNTIVKHDDNSIFLDNTDGIGFIVDLVQNENFIPTHKSILILGAGGAARGILGPLLNENPKRIVIANRSLVNAKNLASQFSVDFISLDELVDQSFDLIVQASTVVPELPTHFRAENAFCYDLNYGPRAHDFKRWAKQQQAHYCDGLGVLIEQAARSFYLWRGVKPQTKELITELRKTTPLPLVL